MNFGSIKIMAKKSNKNLLLGFSIFILLIINLGTILRFDLQQVVANFSVIAFFVFSHLLPNRTSVMRAFLAAVGILLLSFVFQLNNLQRWSVLLVLMVLVNATKFRFTVQPIRIKVIFYSMGYYFYLVTAFRIILHFKLYVLQFMTYGYDNAIHFSIYKAYELTNWYPFVNSQKWASNFNLFRTYPSGQAAIFSFLSGIFSGKTNDPLNELCAYFLLLLLTLIGIAYLAKHLIISKSQGIQTYIAWLAALAITAAFGGVLFVDGFPPYLFGLLLVLIWTASLQINKIELKQTYLLGLTVISLLLVSPLLIPCIIIPGAYIFFREIRAHWITQNYMRIFWQFLYTILLGLTAIKINSVTSSKFGWRQVLAAGGIQPPSVPEAAIFLVLFISVLFMQRRTIFESSITLVAFSTLVSFSFLAILTITYTGTIQYYATKQFYLCLVTISIVISGFLIDVKRSTTLKYLGCVFFTGILLFSFLFSRVFTAGFMGTLPNAIQADFNVGNWRNNIVDANSLIDMKKKIAIYPNQDCLIFRVNSYDSDLNSRWANAIGNSTSTSEECFSAYWNSNRLTDQQLLDRLKSSTIDFALIVGRNQAKNFSMKLPTNVSLVLESIS